MIGAGKQQVRVPFKPSFSIAVLVALVLSSAACVAMEPGTNGVTPIVIPTRVPPEATATMTASVTRTPESQSVAPAGCAAPSGSGSVVPTASSSRSSTPEASATPSAASTPVSERLVSPRDVPPPSSLQPIATRTDLILENQVRTLLGANLDGYAVAAIDLSTGRSVSVNTASVFYSASVFKVWVMYEVFHQESLGLFSLSDELVMTPYYDAFGLGPRATELCQRLTVLEAMEAMMSISDNAAAVLLQDLVGAPNINSSLEALGLTDSRLNTEDIPITAQDMALLLEYIASGKAVSREASEVMASLMTMETFDNGLDAGVPSVAVAAHKTGNWPNARHDVGIVFGPRSTYVIAILSDNREGSYGMIEAISTLVYEAFNR